MNLSVSLSTKNKLTTKHDGITAYMIKCGFGADNQGFCPASALVLFDRKATRNPHLIIYAERYHAL
jgi:hypothetical protein